MSEVRRETSFDREPEEVWRAISDEEQLERWLGEEVELDPVEGGDVRVRTDGEERLGTVEEIDHGSRIVFTWARPGEERSRVELTVWPDPDGARLVVVESLPDGVGPIAWTGGLSALHDSLELVVA